VLERVPGAGQALAGAMCAIERVHVFGGTTRSM